MAEVAFLKVAGPNGKVELIREGSDRSKAPRLLTKLYRGDRVWVQGKESELKIRFHEDALELTILGDDRGGAEVLLGGRSESDYTIHLDRGAIRGLFLSGPIEKSRNPGERFIPLCVTSPVARLEVESGQEFEIRQEKANLVENWFQRNRKKGEPETFTLRFEGFDLDRLVTQNLADIMNIHLKSGPGMLRGKKATILCNKIPAGMFPEVVNRALGSAGLELAGSAPRFSLQDRAGGPLPPLPGSNTPAHGEFTVFMVVDGKARLSSRNPEVAGMVSVFGGQIGLVRPGRKPEAPRAEPRLPLQDPETALELVGTYLGSGERLAVVRWNPDGSLKTEILSLGDTAAGYRLEWVDWDFAVFTKGTREFELRLE